MAAAYSVSRPGRMSIVQASLLSWSSRIVKGGGPRTGFRKTGSARREVQAPGRGRAGACRARDAEDAREVRVLLGAPSPQTARGVRRVPDDGTDREGLDEHSASLPHG